VRDPAEYPFLLSLVMAAADHFRDEIMAELATHGYGISGEEGAQLATLVDDRAWAFLVSLHAERHEVEA
jgi:hypothetical protein